MSDIRDQLPSAYSRDTVAQEMGVAPGRIQPATRQALLDSLDAILQQNISGEQILLVFPTHGGRSADDQKSTILSLGNGETMETDDPELIRRFQE